MNKLLLLIFVNLLLFFTACEEETTQILSPQKDSYATLRDSINHVWHSNMIATAKDITDKLSGLWTIDSIELDFKDSYHNAQIGVKGDTVWTHFGHINFEKWELLTSAYADSTSYQNEFELIYDGQAYPIRLNYLIHSPETGKVFSILDRNFIEGNENWSTSTGWFLNHLGIFDNIEIVKINDDEFYFKGLNLGITKIKLRRL